MSEHISKPKSDYMSQHMSDFTVGQISEHSPEHVPAFMIDPVSEHIPPDLMHMSGSICQDSLSIHVPCLPNRLSE